MNKINYLNFKLNADLNEKLSPHVLIKKNNNDNDSSTNYQTQTHNRCTRRMTKVIYNLILFLAKYPYMRLAARRHSDCRYSLIVITIH